MASGVRTEPTAKRIRMFFNGETVADSSNVTMVWEKPYYPAYYFPMEDVAIANLVENGETMRSPSRGPGVLHDLVVGDRTAHGAARTHGEAPIEELRTMITFDWQSMDAWFEEDEQVYVHARDPHTRVDVLPSSRTIRIEIDGVEIAKSTNARFLFETGLPTRYYIPKTDVRMDLLTATDLSTECPYKGVASYYTVTTPSGSHENIAWWYPFPTPESAEIAGMLSFYNEKVDIWLDGELTDRPSTHFG